ncbi:MAG TPA: ABC transporter permease [Clostridiaceae bacterium]|nr:ABC transporter permease [Clostridiaceae bacterium]
MTIAQVLSAIQLGLLYGILAVGLYIPFRILDIADMSVQGTFTMGMIIAAVFSYNRMPILGIVVAVLGGAVFGIVTGILHTKFNIPSILSGILTMTALYTVNLLIASGKANISLIGKDTIYTIADRLINNDQVTRTVVTLLIVILMTLAIAVFFHTRTGLTIRATGDNAAMVRHTSINTDNMKMIGLSLGNAMAALSGALISQYNLFADVNSGTGILVVALAAIIIGETLFKRNGVTLGLISTVVGSIIYRFIIAIALKFDVLPSYALNLISTIIVIIALMLPAIKETRERKTKKRLHQELVNKYLNDVNNLSAEVEKRIPGQRTNGKSGGKNE